MPCVPRPKEYRQRRKCNCTLSAYRQPRDWSVRGAWCGMKSLSVSTGISAPPPSGSGAAYATGENDKGMGKHWELNFDDYVAVLRRRRRHIIFPAVLGVTAGFMLSLVLPRQYTSHTVVLVEQPTVPDSYVKPVVSEDDRYQRLASMQEQILSRTPLQQLVEKFGLYKKDAKQVPMEQLVERLRKSIKVTPLNPMPGTRSPELPG